MTLVNALKKMLIGRAFTTERGRIRLFGYMDWTLVPSWVFAEILQHIGETKGEKYLYDLGKDQGIRVANEMLKHMGILKKSSWATLKAVAEVLEFIGFGKVQFLKTDKTSPDKYNFRLKVIDNPVAEHAKKIFGKKSLVCHWFMGVYAGHGEVELGLNDIKFNETSCICQGSGHCTWVAKK